MNDVLWRPPPDAWRTTNIGRFTSWLEETRGLAFADYVSLQRWSVTDLDAFWDAVVEFFGIRLEPRAGRVLSSWTMPGAQWFAGSRTNYAEHMLRHFGTDVCVIAESQTRPSTELSWDQLRDLVARARVGLQRLGVGEGDRVAALLPNVPETLVAFLATASLGAIWSSCAPEFGVRAVVDRFEQIEPTVLVAIDAYRYGSRTVDVRENVAAIRRALPTLRATVGLRYGGEGVDAADLTWDELLAESGELSFVDVPFEHPLYVLYSSGTTGKPKPIVHGHGGIMLEHAKTLGLHGDLRPSDRFFWFTTTGWMMWNYVISGLLHRASIVLFDGDPAFPSLDALWSLAERTRTTWFGASAPFLMSCRKAGLRPVDEHDLSSLRAVGSTGAPLPEAGFRWVYDAVGDDVLLSSMSGGTDVCTAFVGGCPVVSVVAGEISCRYLGAAVEAFDDRGRSVVGERGELVLTQPMPSMPVGLWGDDDGSRYRATYFDRFPGVWSHGDWIEFGPSGSCVISGRSDATLNRGGVRIGTSEFYGVVESVPGVADSLIVHLEDDAGGPGVLVLFVAAVDGAVIDDGLRDSVRRELRTALSPRHVPDEIHALRAIPTTLSGKKLEVPVKRILLGASVGDVASAGALRDPTALDDVATIARRR